MSTHHDFTDELVGDRYRLRRLLGSGGMGEVWEAWDERLERAVAVKRLHPQPGVSAEETAVATGRAMREARITARLQHPHAVSVYDVVEDHGQPCLVMQLVPSEPLSARLKGGLVLPVNEVALLGWHLASALVAAHQAGIVHRDVKPGNVLVAEDGTARISDFGIAHAMGDVTLTSTGMVTGTPAYLAPEIARGEDSGYPADVFSLGATLYTALEGRPPFGADGNPMALLHRVASGVVDPPQRSGALTPLLTEMLQPRPEDRPDMAEVADDLADLAFGGAESQTQEEAEPGLAMGIPSLTDVEAGGARLPFGGPAAPDPSRRRGRIWALVAGLLVLAALAVWLIQWRNGSTPTQAAPNAAASTSAPVSSSAPPSTSPPATTSSAPATSGSSSAASPSTGPSTDATSTSSSGPTSSAATTPVSTPPSAAELSAAISGYYGLLPSGTDQTWPLMTARYQTDKAGGRAAYQRFWNQFSAVQATDVVATPPSSVVATVTYTFKDGRVVRERTTFGVVDDGGALKIDSSSTGG